MKGIDSDKLLDMWFDEITKQSTKIENLMKTIQDNDYRLGKASGYIEGLEFAIGALYGIERKLKKEES